MHSAQIRCGGAYLNRPSLPRSEEHPATCTVRLEFHGQRLARPKHRTPVLPGCQVSLLS